MVAVGKILSQIGIAIVMSLLTERFMKKLIVIVIRWIASRTKNRVDNNIANEVEAAFFPEEVKKRVKRRRKKVRRKRKPRVVRSTSN